MWLMFRFFLQGNHYKERNHPKCWIPVKYLPYQVISNKKPKDSPKTSAKKKRQIPHPPLESTFLIDFFFCCCVFLSWFPNFGSTWFLGSRFVFHPTTCGAVWRTAEVSGESRRSCNCLGNVRERDPVGGLRCFAVWWQLKYLFIFTPGEDATILTDIFFKRVFLFEHEKGQLFFFEAGGCLFFWV